VLLPGLEDHGTDRRPSLNAGMATRILESGKAVARRRGSALTRLSAWSQLLVSEELTRKYCFPPSPGPHNPQYKDLGGIFRFDSKVGTSRILHLVESLRSC
jgi:hypothetical protein